MGLGKPLDELTDTLRPDGSVQRLRATRFGLSLQVRAYEKIMRTLGVGGYLSPETRPAKNMLDYGSQVLSKCFEFDWRRSLPENAILFGEMVEAVLRFAQQETGSQENLKCDVVAHSMGGLLLRYYLRHGKKLLSDIGDNPAPTWEGAQHVEHVMLVGTPNAGSLNAVDKLVAGLKKNAVMPGYDPALLGTMPSVYQLLPRGRHHTILDAQTREPIENLLDLDTWISHKWGLANPDADPMLRKLLPESKSAAQRRQIALDHLAKCLAEAKQFHRVLDYASDPPAGVIMQLFAGDGMQTPSLAEVGEGGRSFKVLENAVGDGTVLRSSALMDERVGNPWYPRLLTPIKWDNITFIATDHMALTRHPTFVNNALYLLLQKPRPTCDYRVRTLPPETPETPEAADASNLQPRVAVVPARTFGRLRGGPAPSSPRFRVRRRSRRTDPADSPESSPPR